MTVRFSGFVRGSSISDMKPPSKLRGRTDIVGASVITSSEMCVAAGRGIRIGHAHDNARRAGGFSGKNSIQARR